MSIKSYLARLRFFLSLTYGKNEADSLVLDYEDWIVNELNAGKNLSGILSDLGTPFELYRKINREREFCFGLKYVLTNKALIYLVASIAFYIITFIVYKRCYGKEAFFFYTVITFMLMACLAGIVGKKMNEITDGFDWIYVLKMLLAPILLSAISAMFLVLSYTGLVIQSKLFSIFLLSYAVLMGVMNLGIIILRIYRNVSSVLSFVCLASMCNAFYYLSQRHIYYESAGCYIIEISKGIIILGEIALFVVLLMLIQRTGKRKTWIHK